MGKLLLQERFYMTLSNALIIQPSRLAVGEEFSLKIKLRGEIREITSKAQWNTIKPALHGPFNINTERDIRYFDNCPEGWKGTFKVCKNAALDGETEIFFDGVNQGAYENDNRAIKVIDGFKWKEPGFHFICLKNKATGKKYWSNPAYVSEKTPELRLYWGDPHWQTFFSDGIRCPEELYAFARDEAFLDFGAISDHMEAVTDRQWDYFQGVTNDFNQPGIFATLIGQEWTNHKYGHRNIYFRGNQGPVIRSTVPEYNTLEKL